MDDRTRAELLDDYQLGEAARTFCGSPLGKYMLARATDEANSAYTQLSRVWPWRRRKIEQLQAQIWRAESFAQWIMDAQAIGKIAQDMLEKEDE